MARLTAQRSRFIGYPLARWDMECLWTAVISGVGLRDFYTYTDHQGPDLLQHLQKLQKICLHRMGWILLKGCDWHDRLVNLRGIMKHIIFRFIRWSGTREIQTNLALQMFMFAAYANRKFKESSSLISLLYPLNEEEKKRDSNCTAIEVTGVRNK